MFPKQGKFNRKQATKHRPCCTILHSRWKWGATLPSASTPLQRCGKPGEAGGI